MRKYQWILFVALIGMAFTIIACEYADDLIHPVLTEPGEEVTETETTQTETETTQTETSDN